MDRTDRNHKPDYQPTQSPQPPLPPPLAPRMYSPQHPWRLRQSRRRPPGRLPQLPRTGRAESDGRQTPQAARRHDVYQPGSKGAVKGYLEAVGCC